MICNFSNTLSMILILILEITLVDTIFTKFKVEILASLLTILAAVEASKLNFGGKTFIFVKGFLEYFYMVS